MIVKAPAYDSSVTGSYYCHLLNQRDADHKYYLREFVKWLDHNYWTGLGSYNIPRKDVAGLLKEAEGK